MFGRWTKAKTPAEGEPVQPRKNASPSVIAADMRILGNVMSEGVMDIDGQIEGNVQAQFVTVRANGKIRGDLMADGVHVYGTVEGLIKAQDVVLFDGAHVTGTIMHESLSVDDGAFVDGKFKRTDRVSNDTESEPRSNEVVIGRLTGPSAIDVFFDNDNQVDEASSDAEMKILENLRLIS